VSAEKLFAGLTVLVGIIVVPIVVYAVYVRPPDHPVDTATIEVSGTPGIRFEGTIWTMRGLRHVAGETPHTFEFDMQGAYPAGIFSKTEDYQPESTGTLKVAVRVGGRTVAEGQTRSQRDRYVSVAGRVPPDSLKP